MKNKNKLLLLFIGGLITICLLIGASYAYFAVLLNTDGNNNKFSVKTENLGNIKWTGVKAYESDAVIPGEVGIQTFTVEKNSETGKGIYEIDLKGIVDEAFGSDIEITLYKTTEPDNNYVSVIEGKGKLTGSGTLHYTKGDSLNITGTPKVVYGPRKLQTKDPIVLEQVDFDNETLEKTTYYLVYNYKDSGKSQDDQQGKSFSGEISVKLILDKSPALSSEMTVNYTSNRTDYVNTNETINITATSTYYDIVSYSFDNETYTSVPSASKEVSVTKTYEEETEETIYFKDTDDNIKSEKITTIKLDKTAPKITASASDIWASSNKLSINLKDEKSGLSGYQVTETETEPTEWLSVSGNDTTIEKEIISNNTYYIYGKDVAGNISHEKIKVTHVDNTPPTIISLTEQDSYGATSTITAVAKDIESGITGYAFTETSTEPTSWTSVDNVIIESTYTYTATKNGTIYFWLKDGAGHTINKAITVTKVDVTAPTITFNLSDETTWTTSKTLTMNFSDNESGLAGYAVTTSSSSPTTWISISGTSVSKTQSITKNGTYYVWVKDKASLVSHTSVSIDKVDLTAPTASMTLTKTSNSITIDASTSSDTESGIAKYEYSIDGTTYYSSTNSTYTFTGLSDGTYTVYLKVTDKADNISNIINDGVVIFTPININAKITQLATSDKINLATDDYGNVRYIGKNPNNYVSIDGELWRIIGVMKNIDDGIGNKENRVKLIRNDSIGLYSWDSSAYAVNQGHGVNEWSQADLMKLLNPGYESESVGGSLYWNNQSGTCYNSNNNGTTSCNFTSIGIKNDLKLLINDAVWNTGSYISFVSGTLVKDFYEFERNDHSSKGCKSGVMCNDTVTRTQKFTSKVGLMYLSDFGYATSGGSNKSRSACLNYTFTKWTDSSVSDCKDNSWLLPDWSNWMLSPSEHANWAYAVWVLANNGKMSLQESYGQYHVKPVVYLKSSVQVTGGNGSLSNPYTLS